MVFVDTGGSRPHACYDPDADRFFNADSLLELRGYRRIFLDSSLFPGMWIELKELVPDGAEVYYFTRPWRWRELRKMFKDELRERFRSRDVRKSDFGDAYILWMVYEVGVTKGNLHKWFRPITLMDVELRPLLMLERDAWEAVRRLKKRRALGVEVPVDEVRLAKKMLKNARMRVVEAAERVTPWAINAAERLGLGRDDVGGLTGLIGLLTHMKPRSYHQSLRYLGLFKARSADGRRRKKCSKTARRYLVMLAESLHSKNGEIWPPRLRDLRKLLRTVVSLVRELEPAGV